MKYLKKSIQPHYWMSTALLILSACGDSPIPSTPEDPSQPINTHTGSDISPHPTPTLSPQPQPKPDPQPSPISPPSLEPLRFGYQIRGTRGGPSGLTSLIPQQQALSGIYTDTTLRVTVTANSSGSILNPTGGISGYSYYSDCFTFNIALNNLAAQFVTVKAGSPDGTGICVHSGSPASPTVDFSSQLPHGYAGPITLTLSRAQSTTCGPTAYNTNLYCMLQDLYATYIATGTLFVAIDGGR